MVRFLFLNLVFFYCTGVAGVSYKEMSLLIYMVLQKIKTTPMPRLWQCSNYQVILKPNRKAK